MPNPKLPAGLLVKGLALSLILGALLGYLRYWLGFFVLAQGACLGLLTPWLSVKLSGGKSPEHPGFQKALSMAMLWFLACNLGLMIGFGLAQPWFDPVGWLGRIWEDRTAEFVFGVASTAGMSRGWAMGAQGGFWLVLNLIDWAIMFFFLWIMPWSIHGSASSGKKAQAAQ